MKSYTDLEQSRKLVEILPIESADMYWFRDDTETPKIYPKDMMKDSMSVTLPCWSLAALLDILPDRTCVYKKTYKDGIVKYKGVAEGIKELILKDNPVDACVAMIEKLHELNLL